MDGLVGSQEPLLGEVFEDLLKGQFLNASKGEDIRIHVMIELRSMTRLVVADAYTLQIRGLCDADDRDIPDGNMKTLPVCPVKIVNTTRTRTRRKCCSRERYDLDELRRECYAVPVDMND